MAARTLDSGHHDVLRDRDRPVFRSTYMPKHGMVGFAEKQWDLTRANLPATCLICQSDKNPRKNVKRKLS